MSVTEKTNYSVECRNCKTPMVILKIKQHSGKWPLMLIAAGVFCCLFVIGALIGIPMLLLGIYMATIKNTISYCPNCGYYFKVWMVKENEGSG
ncbi:MAG TPA: LITAF-like zinc ribbon domain-containing protein [Anaerolineae bacterium]|nr:LITAF-like zinc ribbon domain-containing protein [Anaerolineae bacterium]